MDPKPTLIIDVRNQLDRTDLAGAANVRCASGAQIISGDLDQAHAIGEIELAAVVVSWKLVGRRIYRADRHILRHSFVCEIFDPLQLVVGECAARVERYIGGAEMKSNVVKTVQTMNKP